MHPVLFSRIVDRRTRGESVTLIDIGTRRTRTTEHAQHFLEMKPQGDLALANGIMRLLVERGTWAKDFVSRHCAFRGNSEPATLQGKAIDFDAFRLGLALFTPEYVEEISGVSPKDLSQVHEESAAIVNRTVNTTLTLRNWVIGHYIDRYELSGLDRAKYGEGVINALADALAERGVTRCERRELYRYVKFRRTYPQIAPAAAPLLMISGGTEAPAIVETPSPQSGSPGDAANVESLTPHWRSVAEANGPATRESLTPQSGLSAQRLLRSLSFSHFAELLEIEEPLKRAFYEIECIRGNWSVRALQRQIATLYFERSAWSGDKEMLSKMTNAAVERAEPRLAIRDPYVFEFLGLRAEDAVSESMLEAALIRHLHDFLLELGHGFCLEASQKSIVIGSTRGFVDLVFYHRVLKCHVLIDLKIDRFTHENFGQLNTYVNWYRQNMMTEGDNPPIGLLLCTQKDNALVQYATANVASDIFVSKYQVELPTPEELERFLSAKRRELTGGGDT